MSQICECAHGKESHSPQIEGGDEAPVHAFSRYLWPDCLFGLRWSAPCDFIQRAAGGTTGPNTCLPSHIPGSGGNKRNLSCRASTILSPGDGRGVGGAVPCGAVRGGGEVKRRLSSCCIHGSVHLTSLFWHRASVCAEATSRPEERRRHGSSSSSSPRRSRT